VHLSILWLESHSGRQLNTLWLAGAFYRLHELGYRYWILRLIKASSSNTYCRILRVRRADIALQPDDHHSVVGFEQASIQCT